MPTSSQMMYLWFLDRSAPETVGMSRILRHPKNVCGKRRLVGTPKCSLGTMAKPLRLAPLGRGVLGFGVLGFQRLGLRGFRV